MSKISLSQQLEVKLPSPLQPLHHPVLEDKKLQVWVKRDDLIHPIISGNKWRKLSASLEKISELNATTVVSFGGGFSNHLHALGYCCHKLGLTLHAIVRGDYSVNPTAMLQDLRAWGTHVHYVDKVTYQRRADADYQQKLLSQFPSAYFIPEGGSHPMALPGLAELWQECPNDIDYCLIPVASGGTLAGLVAAQQQFSDRRCQILGVAVLKGQGYLESLVQDLLPDSVPIETDWRILHDYHFGGYGKRPTELNQWCESFSNHHNIPLEPVYSGKVFYALWQQILTDKFAPGSKILVLHTGGLQGAR